MRDRDGMSDIEAIQNLARPCEFSTLSSSQPPDTLVKQSFYRGGVCLQVMDPLIDLLSSSSGSSSTSRSGLTNLNTTDRSKKDSRVLSYVKIFKLILPLATLIFIMIIKVRMIVIEEYQTMLMAILVMA